MKIAIIILLVILCLLSPVITVTIFWFFAPRGKGQPSYFMLYFNHFLYGEHIEETGSRCIANAKVLCTCAICHKELWINTMDSNDPDHFRPVVEKILIRSEGLNVRDFKKTREEISRQLRFLRNNEEYRAWQTEDWRRRNPLPSEDKEVDTV